MTPVAATIAEVRSQVAAVRREGCTIGLVPTMGALHAGHASLIKKVSDSCGFVVVSIFVNPTQFGPSEDFARYPRTMDADRAVCAATGAHLIFAPGVDEMYPADGVTTVEVATLGNHLCGPSRPGHFRGVATVVLKLLNIVQPDIAIFGAKDGQQVRIIRQMVRDLNVPVRIDIAPTIREPDGLAMSSRNRYLSPAERAAVPGIYRELMALSMRVAAGETDVSRLEAALRAGLEAIPGLTIDYARIVDERTLQPLARLDRPAMAAVAVLLGSTRLIDNITLP